MAFKWLTHVLKGKNNPEAKMLTV